MVGVGTCSAPAALEDLSQEWTQAPALGHTGTQGVRVGGGLRPSEDPEEGTAAFLQPPGPQPKPVSQE